MASSEGQDSAVHIWICDTEGSVHVLCHVTDNIMKWREVDGTISQIHCSQNVVCGISQSDQDLCIRTGVSFESPLGKKWARTGCLVEKIAVGRSYVAAWLKDGGILIGEIGLIRNTDFCPLKWFEIDDATPTNLKHISMNCNDVLFGVTANGDTYGCYGIQEKDHVLKWELLSKAPPLAKRRGFFRSLFQSEPSNLFDSVSCFSDGIWCYKKESHELWLLTIQGIIFSNKLSRKASWTRHQLPDSTPKLAAISCHSLDQSILYGISENGDNVYMIKLVGPVIQVSELPFHGCGDIVMVTLSCSLVDKKEDESATPSLYPKLPKKEKGLCCENGTCSFCQYRSNLEARSTPQYRNIDYYREQLKKYKKEGRKHYSLSSAETRYSIPVTETGEDDFDTEPVSRKRRRDDNDELSYLSPCHQVTPPPLKKRRYRRRPFTYPLIEDIPIAVTIPSVVSQV